MSACETDSFDVPPNSYIKDLEVFDTHARPRSNYKFTPTREKGKIGK